MAARYALFSDVHANLPAMEAVLEDIRARRELTGIYHLGDLVGYAPWPDEVVAMIRDAGIPGVAGNYDSTVATHDKHCGCRYGHVAGPAIRLFHGNHALNTVYVTEDRSDEFLSSMARNMGSREGDVVCFGHTHEPWHRVVEGIHFVNTGSVGRPKDGDPRAGYVLLDVSATGIDVEFVRIAYDVGAAARAILSSTLPDEFAEYLRTGGALGAPSP